MVFDLGQALHRKAEHESARLDDFGFRLRARTMRLLADALGRDPVPLVAAIALHDDDHILADLGDDARAAYRIALAEARTQLTAELGDPSPHRLA
ncbi:hypothetical protein [Polymorphobacter fuscus]|uniref:Uncharacterized protein n=1 Tax=Sandarakinorhabdus fusca TaxID=1439888 RepID=A0A7C9GSU7_9SPHN|nr:hypothetical protein [Polymorphobacter fuscus]KAB7648242.1 hypothetical protein F9290_00520 [Polymorphobacter fuscus]MQT15749.1 hypothetical protein [Polymorphobacter fuscus]NJC07980.1 hypothetical protein [Polymorphobacter fuscus]